MVKVGAVTSATGGTQETVLEAEKRDKIPRGFTMYLSEQISNAITGKGPKDPAKIISKALEQYSESPYYKILKNAVKKTGEAAIWLIDKTFCPFPMNKDFIPFYTGEPFNMQQGVYM